MKSYLLLILLGVFAFLQPSKAAPGCFDFLHQAMHQVLEKSKTLWTKAPPPQASYPQETNVGLRQWVFHRYPQESLSRSLSTCTTCSLSWSGVWFDKEELFFDTIIELDSLWSHPLPTNKVDQRLIGKKGLQDLFQVNQSKEKQGHLTDSQIRELLLNPWGSQNN